MKERREARKKAKKVDEKEEKKKKERQGKIGRHVKGKWKKWVKIGHESDRKLNFPRARENMRKEKDGVGVTNSYLRNH